MKAGNFDTFSTARLRCTSISCALIVYNHSGLWCRHLMRVSARTQYQRDWMNYYSALLLTATPTSTQETREPKSIRKLQGRRWRRSVSFWSAKPISSFSSTISKFRLTSYLLPPGCDASRIFAREHHTTAVVSKQRSAQIKGTSRPLTIPSAAEPNHPKLWQIEHNHLWNCTPFAAWLARDDVRNTKVATLGRAHSQNQVCQILFSLQLIPNRPINPIEMCFRRLPRPAICDFPSHNPLETTAALNVEEKRAV